MDSETLLLLSKLQTGAVTILATAGAPTTGTWFTGDITLDSQAVLWICTAGGSPGIWATLSTAGLIPVSKAANYAAVKNDLVVATASLTVTSPAASLGTTFGVTANYAASYASPVTVTASSGYIIGPGVPASTSSILLGAESSHVVFVSDGTNWFITEGGQDTGWATLTLASPWVTAYSGDPPSIRVIGNIGLLSGRMKGGTTDSLFVNALPSGIPTRGTTAFVTGNAQISSTQVESAVIQGFAANLSVQFTTASPQWVSLWGITYTID